MTVGNRWILMLALAAAAAAGAVAASGVNRRRVRTASELDERKNLKAWENEGGNLAPASAAPVRS